jgi:putative ABC transport system permease protein
VEAWSFLIVRSMEGVRVRRVSSTNERLGEKMDIHFVGFDTTTGLGGPIEVIEGSDTPGEGEVIIDQALSDRYGVKVGHVLRAGGRDWEVVGISRGGDFVATQTVFVNHQQAQEALSMPGITTFYVVSLKDGEDAVAFSEDVEELAEQVVVHTREEFASSTRERVLSDVLPILFVVLALSFIVGLAVAGLTIYTATISSRRL